MMLDPLTALSLAGTVVQFVDFTAKILAKGSQIHKSADGSLLEYEDLETVTIDLIRLNERLRISIHSSRVAKQLSSDEQALERLAHDCAFIAQELLDQLQKLKLQGKRTKLKSIRQAFRNVYNRSDLEEIEKRLDKYREELEMHLLVSLREQADLSCLRQTERFDNLDRASKLIISYIVDNQTDSRSDVYEKLAALHEGSERRLIREHEKTRYEIRKALKQRNSIGSASYNLDMGLDNDGPIAPDWEFASEQEQHQMSVIRDSLWFPMIEERHDSILEHHKNTFDWIYLEPNKLTRPWSNFSNFLKGNESVYWISGKPGSGKSTLMKYLYDNPQTGNMLKSWADNRDLLQNVTQTEQTVRKHAQHRGLLYDDPETQDIIKKLPVRPNLLKAAFFFWNSGTLTQRTLESLLRSLLLKALKPDSGYPELIPIVLCEQSTGRIYELAEKEGFQWSLAQLKRAFDRLLHQTEYPIKLFFMIDGLDECDHDHTELTSFLLRIVSPSVKILVSSRPWNVFRDAFTSMPQLRLQDLTHRDIKLYIEDNLKSNQRMQQLLEKDSKQAEALASEIVSRASGVFIWVRVVVASLIVGLRNYDKITDLQARLLLLPSELADLYQHILNRMDPTYQIHCTKYLLLRRAAGEPPLTLAFSLAEEDDTELCLRSKIKLMTKFEAMERCEEVDRRLEASCAGLIEVDYRKKIELPEAERHRPLTNNDYYRTAFGSTVQYLHRTVRDFFDSPEYANQIKITMAGTDFDPNLPLLRAWILRLKMLPLPFIEPKGHFNRESNSAGIKLLNEIQTQGTEFARLARGDPSKVVSRLLLELNQTVTHYRINGSRVHYLEYGKFEGYWERKARLELAKKDSPSTDAEAAREPTPKRESPMHQTSEDALSGSSQNIFHLLFCCYGRSATRTPQ